MFRMTFSAFGCSHAIYLNFRANFSGKALELNRLDFLALLLLTYVSRASCRYANNSASHLCFYP